MTQAVIFAEQLTKTYRTRRGPVSAVSNFTLSVARGETFGLIGPDGAGKTTVTRVMLGLLSRSSGSSRILGCDSMRDVFAIRERVGYIAQQFALPADLSVLENMRFFAQVQGVSSARQRDRIPELLEFAGLTGFAHRLAGQLSGGMKKKLALACSLVHEPEVVLLDEPTLGVDPVSRRELWNLLGKLHAEKELTVFVCTPYMDEAERCNRVGLLYAGRLVAQGTPDSIKEQVNGELVEINLTAPGPAKALLAPLEGVSEVHSYGLALRVLVDDAQKRMPLIAQALAAGGLPIERMRETEVRMEEAFVSLIRCLDRGDDTVRSD